MLASHDKLTLIQLELLKSFRFIRDEKQLKEIKSLLNFYFRQKLDATISEEEEDRDYTAAVYRKWLESSQK